MKFNGRTIAIVGAGFCGSVLASNLLRRPPAEPTRILLIERGTRLSRGMAYAAHDVPYILNVPAGRLSVNPDDPMEFLRFARQAHPEADAEDFLPRALYGDYLQEVLDRAELAAPPHVTLIRMFGEVTRLGVIASSAAQTSLEAHFADRAPVAADQVVLALGNPRSALHSWAIGVAHHPAYIHDPWTLPRKLQAHHSVLIVGSGLTMVDVALALSLEPGRLPLVRAISRHGLLPLGQTIFRPTAVQGSGEALLSVASSLRCVLAASRALASDVERLGGDWREVVTFIRHLAPELWRRLPLAERRRFLRHVQPYWDVHRHRLPPRMAQRIDHMRRSGRLEVHAGRIRQLVPEGEELRVIWRRRGKDRDESFAAHAVINATGPDYALHRSTDPLLRSLSDQQLVRADELGLGLCTGPHGACIGADGTPRGDLFYLGPMLRADHWEATAVPELRAHAEGLARHLAGPAG